MTVTPTVHAGGTPAHRLIDAHVRAAADLARAAASLIAAAPHARDYPNPGHDFMGHRCSLAHPCPLHRGAMSDYQVACAEHEARLAALRSMRREMEVLADCVSDQVDAAAAAVERGAYDDRDQT